MKKLAVVAIALLLILIVPSSAYSYNERFKL